MMLGRIGGAMMFKKIKISTRIYSAILLVVLSTIAVIVVAVISLQAIDSAFKDAQMAAYRNQLAGDASLQFVTYALSVEQLPRLSSQIGQVETQKTANKYFGETERLLNELAPILVTDQGRAELRYAQDILGSIRRIQFEVQAMIVNKNAEAIDAKISLQSTLVDSARASLRKIEERNIGFFKDASEKILVAQSSAKIWIMFIGLGSIVIALLLASSIVIFGVTRPLRELSQIVSQLAEGNTDILIPTAKGKDEIAVMTRGVSTFRENAIRVKNLAAEEEVAKAKAEDEKEALLGRIANDFNQSVSSIIDQTNSAVEKLTSAACVMEQSATESSHQSVSVSHAANEASINVNLVATATEQLNAAALEIAHQVAASTRIADQAKLQVKNTTKNALAQAAAAQRIGDIVDMISSLAAQTNLLALNATIEAARAGDAGRGFAVVASEVKSLAEQTSRATGSIAEQIADIRTTTTTSGAAIEQIASTISEMAEIALGIASAIDEQKASTNEIAHNVRAASKGTDEVSMTIQSVSQASLRTGETAADVKRLADSLAQQSHTLRSSVDGFLNTIGQRKMIA
jgi:methyl-accepting chemotaxis protein